MVKWLYFFGNGRFENTSEMLNLLGGKGINLAEMSSIGLPVPPGFTITTEVCKYYYSNNNTYPGGLKEDILQSISMVEDITGSKFGDPFNPLLFSVRSGSRVSMPGMMDTVLNLGLNDITVKGLGDKFKDERFAWDSYRRFIQMYSDVVLGLDHSLFEDLLEIRKDIACVLLDTDLMASDFKLLVADYKKLVLKETNINFPEDPLEQLWGAVGAVFKSWMSPRACKYRELNNISESWGTAVTVQSMVFGNMGDDCLTGVAFTRDPSTGENVFYGEYLVNAQGEDVVSGIRTPNQLTIAGMESQNVGNLSLEGSFPHIFEELCKVRIILEKHYLDMQDIEFTVQRNKLYLLQTRSGKRTIQSALKIACDMVDEELIDIQEALLRIPPRFLDKMLHPTLDKKVDDKVIAKGLPASPGGATGEVVFCADEAERLAKENIKTILVRIETSPEDIHGMYSSEGILTSRGGMTSHAAVVARGMGRPCVSGASLINILYKEELFTVDNLTIKKGDYITIDGTTGEVILGKVSTLAPKFSPEYFRVMRWADSIRTLKVRTNSDTPLDSKIARDFGAEGIGLCRTEHMFFDSDRIKSVRQMILSDTKEDRSRHLEDILPMQRKDFENIFKVMNGLPVTIRLLDPPLHEFLPNTDNEYAELLEGSNFSIDRIKRRASELHEFNPMLGYRGCRLLNTYPEICEMQSRAIFEALVNVKRETSNTVNCEIMIPLVAMKSELNNLKLIIENVAKDIERQEGEKLDYILGTMIELPRAALKADDIAEQAEFFSFGTNDLTQTVYGLSRDDSGNFLSYYKSSGILEEDPFQTLDIDGVGELIEIAIRRGKLTRPDIKIGICGEHGGDPDSIEFFHKVGLQYISCSPYRVPIARLAAAQAAIRYKKDSN